MFKKSEFKKSTAGFTLLELLVVISIMALLIAMGTVAFSTAQKRGRDAKRRADMQALQKAFEQYYVLNGSAYADCNSMAADQMAEGGMPTDPKPSQSYVCNSDAFTNSYCACALLEESGGGNSTNDGCTYGTGNYFCVNSLQ